MPKKSSVLSGKHSSLPHQGRAYSDSKILDLFEKFLQECPSYAHEQLREELSISIKYSIILELLIEPHEETTPALLKVHSPESIETKYDSNECQRMLESMLEHKNFKEQSHDRFSSPCIVRPGKPITKIWRRPTGIITCYKDDTRDTSYNGPATMKYDRLIKYFRTGELLTSRVQSRNLCGVKECYEPDHYVYGSKDEVNQAKQEYEEAS